MLIFGSLLCLVQMFVFRSLLELPDLMTKCICKTIPEEPWLLLALGKISCGLSFIPLFITHNLSTDMGGKEKF